MNTNAKTLIVSMPIYNAQDTMREAIDSVLSQSYRNLRLVLVDDNSEDSSLAIARSYLKDPRVTVISNNKNMGAYYCRNVGIAWMKKQPWGYFTTHDADDVSFEHRYLQLIRLSKERNVSGIQDSWRRVRINTESFIKEHPTIAHAIFKRMVFDKIGYFETVRFGGDWEYWKRTLSVGRSMNWKFEKCDKVWGKSYVHDKNITTLIPISSPLRRKYMKDSMISIRKMERANDWYTPFEIDHNITKEIK